MPSSLFFCEKTDGDARREAMLGVVGTLTIRSNKSKMGSQKMSLP